MKSKVIVQTLLMVALASPLLQSPAFSVDQASTSPTLSQVTAAPEPLTAPAKSQKSTSEAPVETAKSRSDKLGIFVLSGIFAAMLGFIVMSSLRNDP